MNDEFDHIVEARFDALASIAAPDNWQRIQTDVGDRQQAVPSHRTRVLVAVAAGLLVVGAVVAIAVAQRRGPHDALPPAADQPSCLRPGEGPRSGDCLVVDWNATSVDGATIEFEYFVNPACFDPLVGTDIEEAGDDVVLTVLVDYQGDGDQTTASCGTAVLQRHGSVQLTAPLGGRTLRGCRSSDSSVPQGGYNEGRADRNSDANCNPPLNETNVSTSTLASESPEAAPPGPETADEQIQVPTEQIRIVPQGDFPLVDVVAVGRWESGGLWVDNTAETLCFGTITGGSCSVVGSTVIRLGLAAGPFGELADPGQPLSGVSAFVSSQFVELRVFEEGKELCRAPATGFDGAPEIVGFLCSSPLFEPMYELTYQFLHEDGALWEVELVSPAIAQRLIVDPEVCTSTRSRESAVDGVTLFGRSATHDIPILVIGHPGTRAAGPFAIVERFYDTVHAPSGGGIVDVDGNPVSINLYANGNAQATWPLVDGSQGYLRSRGLDESQVQSIIRSLVPHGSDSDRLGFKYRPRETVPDLILLAAQLNSDVQGEVQRSVCWQSDSDLIYRVAAADGDPVLHYALVIDQPVPREVGYIGDTVVTLSGRDGPMAPTLADVIETGEQEWISLLAQPDEHELELALEASIPIGPESDAMVKLSSIDGDGPAPSMITIGLDESQGVWYLTVNHTTIIAHADAELIVTRIGGAGVGGSRGGISSNVTVGTAEFRIGAYPSAPFTIEITVTNLSDDVLQSTGLVPLVPQPR